jgi:hypothetical protein
LGYKRQGFFCYLKKYSDSVSIIQLFNFTSGFVQTTTDRYKKPLGFAQGGLILLD